MLGMRHPGELPSAFHDAPWSVVEALDLEVTPGRLRGSDLARPFRGVRMLGERPRDALAYAPLLRFGDRFSSTTAARGYGAPLPRWVDDRVHVTAGPGLTAPRMRGVVGHAADGRTASLIGGQPLSNAEETFVELSRILPHADLIAVGDFLVCSPRIPEPGRPFTTIPALAEICARPGRRGIRAARRALTDVRTGVFSPRETRLRMLLIGAGLPEPACDVEVLDDRGRRIGWFDLGYEAFKVLVEYDGDQHRTSRVQYEKDMRRYELAAEAGWITIRVRSWGLGDGERDTVIRVTRALLSRGWIP